MTGLLDAEDVFVGGTCRVTRRDGCLEGIGVARLASKVAIDRFGRKAKDVALRATRPVLVLVDDVAGPVHVVDTVDSVDGVANRFSHLFVRNEVGGSTEFGGEGGRDFVGVVRVRGIALGGPGVVDCADCVERFAGFEPALFSDWGSFDVCPLVVEASLVAFLLATFLARVRYQSRDECEEWDDSAGGDEQQVSGDLFGEHVATLVTVVASW